MTSDQENPEAFVQIVRGHPFLNAVWFTKKNIEDSMDYVPKDGDVIIASYPKTGTTWTQYTVLQIVSKGELFPSFSDAAQEVVPFMEMSGIAAVEALKSNPRIYTHHIPYNLVQKNDKAKYIYVYRNPEDTVVSYYHFLKSFGLPSLSQYDFDEFFDRFVLGDIGYGSYFEHVLSFYEHREDGNLLMVSYEKLHANRREEILRIAKFLGQEYYQMLQEDDGILRNIMEHTTFEYMKKNLFLTRPNVSNEAADKVPDDAPKINFFRKGIVGDGKSTLTDVQREQLKRVAKRILKGTSIIEEWYSRE